MIIHALHQYYERLLADPESGVPRPGYGKAKVSFAINLSPSGELLDLIDLRVEKGKKLIAREVDVPLPLKRTSGIAANFLCDNASYLLGIDAKGKPERATETFQAFAELHARLLTGVDDLGAKAVVAFSTRWDPQGAARHPSIQPFLGDLMDGANLVFRLDGEKGFVHDRPAVRGVWDRHRAGSTSAYVAQCLVTGKVGPIARLHDSIKGVTGAQPSGASLVSFNLDAFTSYGKTQSFNAPVSEDAAFGYTTSLNHLLRSDRHRLRIGDSTTVFWGERSAKHEEDLLAELLDPVWENSGDKKTEASGFRRDPATTQQVRDLLRRVKDGLPINLAMTEVDVETRFYILGLSPNASRLAVRFWHMDTFGGLVAKIVQHYQDLDIAPVWRSDPPYIPVWQILRETAPLRDSSRIPPLLGGALMRSILTASPYPQGLYTAVLTRIRADMDVNYVRTAALKACLLRNARLHGNKEKEVMITVTLNEKTTNTAYRLGRLFALLEKAQQDANPGINATIRDRYFGAASASPGSVFPILLRLAQHHIAKSDYGFAVDKSIEEVMGVINDFPAHLSLEEQGLFVLGYYHQRQAIYQKKDK